MRHLFTSLRARLLILVLLIVLPILGMIAYTAVGLRRVAYEHMQKDISKLAGLIALDDEQLVKEARPVVEALAALPEVRRGDVTACNELLPRLLKQHTRYANLGVAQTNGVLLASAVPMQGIVNVADRDYFQRVMDTRRFSVGEFQIGKVTNKNTINVGQPVLDSNGQVQYVVYAATAPHGLHR